MKRFYLMVMAVAMAFFLLIPGLASAKKMGSGEVTAGNVNLEIFGSSVVQPKYVDNANFNDDNDQGDFLFYTNGMYADHVVRQQTRLGVKGGTENFSFLMTMESEFNFDADNADRETPGNAGSGEFGGVLGSTGSQFGIERLHFEYDMSKHGMPASVFTGWDFYPLDVRGGGSLLLGDDYPYIGVKGSLAKGVTWDVRYFIRDDNIAGASLVNPAQEVDGNDGDWRFVTANMIFPAGPLGFQPTYVYSRINHSGSKEKSNVNYLGLSAWGNFEMGDMGTFNPKGEFFYVTGEQENYAMTPTNEDADIRSIAAFLGAEMQMSPAVTPYLGGYYLQGDDDAYDDEINAYNSLSNSAAISGMFGMPNGLLNQGWPMLGSGPFSNQPAILGGALDAFGPGNAATPYGTNGLTGSSTNPGLMTLGLGLKGGVDNWSYKTQVQSLMFEETGALEDQYNINDIDNQMGYMFDLDLTYKFSKNYSLGNTFSYFQPGDAYKDLYGNNYDEATIYDSVNFTFHF